MLQLRPQHDEAMKAHAVEQYVERTLAQFQEFFPRHCEINGEEPMRAMIRLGVSRAKAHAIVGERNVVLYTTMMLLFGSYFDEDPMTPWARQALADKSIREENARADRLYEVGEQHWQQIAGPDNSNMIGAVMRLRKLDVEKAAQEPEQRWPDWMQRVFPSRCGAIGPSGVAQVLRFARQCAAKHKLKADQDRVVIAALMLMLGARADEDPMYPWIAQCVQPSEDIAPAERGSRLVEAARAYADAWLEHVNEGV